MGQDNFSARLLAWFDQHGRHDLPWQGNRSLYRVWVSEIMLQQTQVSTVIPYYLRFMARFEGIQSLASADLDEVLHLWAGLGYYARGRNLHSAARIIVEQHHGSFPQQIERVQSLPGIGRSTAGAILALALDQRHAILDGNVKRVLCRYHGIKEYAGASRTQRKLWEFSEKHTPDSRIRDYTQAIMDLGAILCTRSKPKCPTCPIHTGCFAADNGLASTIPASKPKRARPHIHRFLLAIIDSEHQLALFKRPTKGIWGGLYSLPEFESLQACTEQLSNYRINPLRLKQQGEDIEHAFSHFDLSITPITLSLHQEQLNRVLAALETPKNVETGVKLGHSKRYNLLSDSDESGLGIPTPIRKLIKQLKIN